MRYQLRVRHYFGQEKSAVIVLAALSDVSTQLYKLKEHGWESWPKRGWLRSVSFNEVSRQLSL